MIHLDRIELLHWDMQPHQVLPLARGITLLVGENGSGKTSLLDAIKVALGVSRLGGDRDVKKYLVKQARSVAMVRVVADNRPIAGGRQRPFDRLGEFASDAVTMAVVYRAQDEAEYVTEHYLLDGDVVPPLDGDRRAARPLPSATDYRQRLAKVGLTDRYLKLLSLPQGQIASLCKKDPAALFDDLYDIIGGRQTLEAWEERLRELRRAQTDYEAIDRDLAAARASLQSMASRVRRHEDWRKAEARRQAIINALPHIELREAKARAGRLGDLSETLAAEISARTADRAQAWARASEARTVLDAKTAERGALKEATKVLRAAHSAAVEKRAEAAAEWRQLEKKRIGAEQIAWEDAARLEIERDETAGARATLASEAKARASEQGRLRDDLSRLERGILPLPPEVEAFRTRLQQEGIAHHLLHEVVELDDPAWQNAVEGYLGRFRFAVLVRDMPSWARAAELARVEKYPHGVLAPDVRGRSERDDGSVFRRLRVQDPDYRALLARLFRPVVEGEPPEPLEPTRHGDRLSRAGFVVSRIEARHAWSDDLFLGVEARRHKVQSLRARLEVLTDEAALAARRDSDLLQTIRLLSDRIEAQRKRSGWEAVRERHAELAVEVAQLQGEIQRVGAQIEGKEEEAGRLDGELQDLRELAGKEQERGDSANDAVRTKEQERVRVESDRQQAESAHGRLLAAPPPEPDAPARAVLDEGLPTPTLNGELSKLGEHLTGFTDDERDSLLPLNHRRQQQEVAAVESRLRSLGDSVEQTRQAAERAHHDYQHATRLVFRGYFGRLKKDAEQLGYRVEGELVNTDNGRFRCELRVGIDEKSPVHYTSPDLSGGQKAALSILMSMTAVSLESDSAGFFLVDEPFSASDVYKINELGEFLGRTQAQYLLSMPTSSDIARCGAWLSATWTSTKSPGGFDASNRPVLAPPIKLGFADGARDG